MTETQIVKNKIWETLISRDYDPKNKMSVFIDGVYYESLFQAGIDSDISFTWLSLRLKRSRGQPVIIKEKIVVTEKWVRGHPECLV